jgi:histidine ammonia-lyase
MRHGLRRGVVQLLGEQNEINGAKSVARTTTARSKSHGSKRIEGQVTAAPALDIVPGNVGLRSLQRILQQAIEIQLDEAVWKRIDACHAVVARAISERRTIYGVNTGFGKLAETRIGESDLATLQRNLILSHCTGAGPDLGDDIVRLVLALKVVALARGHSGVRREIVSMLIGLLAHGVYPRIPSKGSVGASGDLAPLAHLSSVLIGVGDVIHGGKRMPAADGLAVAGLEPIELGPKEGLALINGTQVSTALAIAGLFAAEEAFAAAIVAGAMTVEAAKGSSSPFDARLHAVRGQPGQIEVAAAFRRLFQASGIMAAHKNRYRVQDPYSLRCQPQVMGAVLDSLRHVASILETEANAVSDNPVVFPEDGEVISGGNFHAEPVAIVADLAAIALSEIGAISERRIAVLVDTTISGLPPFLVESSGLNSGFMVAHVSAAALASENKTLAHPASVDSIPTAANQEDHVSMATFAARRLFDIADNVRGIVAIELLAAGQGLDFQRPLRSSPALEEAHALIRERVPRYDRDRRFAEDIAAVKDLIASGTFTRFVDPIVPNRS